ncbi:MAG: MBL fold metallo-hydrolase [Dehalococcoidia bacterium]|jgi:ribonuclease BN (tRNA processing enzyme)
MQIRFLGAHNCETKSTRLVSLLVDGVLAVDVGGLTSALTFEEQQKVEAVLLTHQHFDHVRDVPTLAMTLFFGGSKTVIYATPPVFKVLENNLMDGVIYSDFRRRRPEGPIVSFSVVEPGKAQKILDYDVLAVPVKHSVPTVGYQLTRGGKSFFYTGDTGPGLRECWEQVSPQLLVTEVTAPNRFTGWGEKEGHLTPELLQRELTDFKELKGYLPRVVIVHMSPHLEKEIAGQVTAVAEKLEADISLAYEGMEVNL